MDNAVKNIGVFSPSSWIERERIEQAQTFIEEQGYNVFIHPQTFARYNQSAGTEHDKLTAFYELWENPDIDLIWTASGGNRALHWVEHLDLKKLKSTSGKPIIGFSDVTALLNAITAYTGQTTYHGPVFSKITQYREWSHLNTLLQGQVPDYPTQQIKILKTERAEGHLIGGNLSIFQYLPSMLPSSYFEGAILFLEDCHEELSRLDRMLFYLKQKDIFASINGIILGEFLDIQDTGKPYEFPLNELVLEYSKGHDIPIISEAPFGHGRTLYAYPIGQKISLNTEHGIDFKFL